MSDYSNKGPNKYFTGIAQADKNVHNRGGQRSFTMDMIAASYEETRKSAPRYGKNAKLQCLPGHEVQYSQPHDAYYCLECGDWLTPVCEFETCKHCKERPKHPSELLWPLSKSA